MKDWVYNILFVVSVILLAANVIPLLPFDNWYVRMIDFPRLQILVLTFTVMVIFFITRRHHNSGKIFIAMLFLACFYQAVNIFPYTTFAAVQVHSSKASTNSKNQIKILVSNVLMSNQNHHELIDLVKKEDPDLFLLLESDEVWQSAVDVLKVDYPNTIAIPQDNTYGMHLYSKLPLHNTVIQNWIDKDIPSIYTLIVIPSGDTIAFYGVHPKPPVPTEDEDSKRRDAEIMIVGNRVADSNYPVIVAGDFNDVAWSPTTQLFLKTSGLLDPRRGRGFFNTYNANHILFRWPLDHFFFTSHFKLINMQRLPFINSDHFPISIHLHFLPEEKESQKPLIPEKDTKEKETETINEGIEDARSDYED